MRLIKNKDIVSGLFLLIVSVALFSNTNMFNNSSISSYGNPATVPRIVIVLLFILSLLILLGGIRRTVKDPGTESQTTIIWNDKLLSVLTFILLSGYIISVKPVGYIISTALYLFLQMFILSCFDTCKLWTFGIISCIASPTLFYVFRVFFDVFLPTGILG